MRASELVLAAPWSPTAATPPATFIARRPSRWVARAEAALFAALFGGFVVMATTFAAGLLFGRP